MADQFRGVINLDVRDSVPDWEPFLPPKAEPDAPNVLYVVWDDVGIATWEAFGGRVETPTLNRISELGLRYSNWHTTALCSPTRSSLLTGRNAHANGMACIVEGSTGYPGSCAVIPPENGMLSEVLVEHGYSTYCVGKWHLTPSNESSMAGARRTWPLGRGFERYYGFLGGETNQWYPNLVHDNHATGQPALPEDGYHLSKDLVDKTIEFIRDGSQLAPDKPWLAYLAFGASHAPHHAPAEWIDKYRGRFDDGYEAYREWVLERQKHLGVVPADVELSPLNPWPAPEVIIEGDRVRPWDELGEPERALFARMAEVFAAFTSYTDHELGRLIDYLEQSGQLDNTIVVVCSDNGASGEGSPNGSVNENNFFNGWPDDLNENLRQIDRLGSPDTYNHYPTGWAAAFNTPYKMFKRYTLEGGLADPLIIAWPRRMRGVAGQFRDQYHHAIDIVPTLYDCLGITPPATIKGYPQTPIQGTSMCYSFNQPDAPTTRITQYYEMLGSRALYHDGWKIVAKHGPLSDTGNFGADTWELYHTAEDRAELHDVAAEHPEKVQDMVARWFAIAGRNDVFPLDDRPPAAILRDPRPTLSPPRDDYTYYPGTAEIPEDAAPDIRNRSFTIHADIAVASPSASGILMAQGSRFGGHALYLVDGVARYVYSFLGNDRTTLSADRPLQPGTVSVDLEFVKDHEDPPGVANGTARLLINHAEAASGPLRTQPGRFALAGEGLAIGRETGDPVTSDYQPGAALVDITIDHVTITVGADQHVDEDIQAVGILTRE